MSNGLPRFFGTQCRLAGYWLTRKVVLPLLLLLGDYWFFCCALLYGHRGITHIRACLVTVPCNRLRWPLCQLLGSQHSCKYILSHHMLKNKTHKHFMKWLKHKPRIIKRCYSDPFNVYVSVCFWRHKNLPALHHLRSVPNHNHLSQNTVHYILNIKLHKDMCSASNHKN